MKKIFLTGSCGFLLSNFIRKSIHYKIDYKITSIDLINKNHILSNVFQNKNHSFHIGSCSDKHLINVLFTVEKPDVIIHGSFNESSIEDSMNQTISLLESCRSHGVKKFIFLSSDEVYGSSKDICFKEDFETNPTSYVGVSKSCSENFVKQYCKLYGIDYTIIRISNFFGPRQNKNTLLVDSLFKLKNNKEVILNNDGKNTKDWGHVADAVNGIIKIIDSGSSNQIYNLSRGIVLSELEIVYELAQYLNFDTNLIKINRSNDYTSVLTNSDKLKALGWVPEVNLKSSLEYFSKWYLDNNWWFND